MPPDHPEHASDPARPLAPMERWFVEAHRTAFPMAWFVRATFRGSFERRELEEAARKALVRHPLLRSTVRGRRWSAPLPAREALSLEWLDPGRPPPPCRAPDVRREPGLRLRLREDAGNTHLTILVHHAASDGVAGFAFVREMLARYAGTWTPGTRGSAPGASPESRGSTGEEGRNRHTRDASGPSLKDLVGFLHRRPARLRGEGSRYEADRALPELDVHAFTTRESEAIRGAAQALDGTVNDLFLSALIRAAVRWNEQGGDSGTEEWIRVMVPTALRPRGVERPTPGNALGLAFMERRPEGCRDPLALHAGVRAETKAIRREERGRDFVTALGWLDPVPGLLPLTTRIPTHFVTLAFSNMAVDDSRASFLPPDRSGLPELTALTAAGPLQPWTRATLALTRCRGALTLSLRTDPDHFSREASRRFLETAVEEVDTLVSLADPR